MKLKDDGYESSSYNNVSAQTELSYCYSRLNIKYLIMSGLFLAKYKLLQYSTTAFLSACLIPWFIYHLANF